MDVTLETRRLVLRPPHPADARRMASFLDNFAVSGNLSRVPYPYRLADARDYLARWQKDAPAEETNFVIDLDGECCVGQIGFHGDAFGTVVGYWLAQPFWNRGLMSEAAEGAIAWYFKTTGADELRSGVFHFNRASLAIQRKLGFIETGISMRHCLARGEQVRHIDTILTRAAWAERDGR
ncbi:MAG: GNAT family N-acetyltransferase [Devosia sp.]